ncbi:hypothetical protein [Billgrantia desiderata]|uniref:hypothetical protein n=1 Tax=Billgrantia desiderata TaxID=52021 RepID=UPI00089F6084|nr:hypothetical protein [Halomonas desiderata]SEG14583.1 hypothetical protein SAMN04487953_11529 [Halomonas desiderata]
MKRILMSVALTGLPFAVMAEITEQYDSLSELIHEHGDYDEGNGTFELYSEDPLAFRLSKPAIQGEPAEVTYYENWRAAIYGVYNTFAHTSLDAVTMTAMPLWFESFTKRDSSRLMDEHAIMLEMGRDDALDALRAVTGMETLADIKMMTDFGYQWSPAFLDIYYEDRDPGLDAFIQELRLYCVEICE